MVEMRQDMPMATAYSYKKKAGMALCLFFVFMGLSSVVLATGDELTISGKEVIERLARLEEGQRGLNKRIDDLGKRIDGLGKRIDDQSKRIDDLRSELKGDINGLNKRIDDQSKKIDSLRSELKGDINEQSKRIDDIKGLLYVVIAGIFALIGFVIWDRRTALSPVLNKTRELEEREDMTLRALKEYARKEPKMANVLKSLGMM